MTADEQLRRWVAGESVHNDETGECCPDFSCCQSHFKAEKVVREKFQGADGETRMGMLGHFLSSALMGANVYVAGQGPEQ